MTQTNPDERTHAPAPAHIARTYTLTKGYSYVSLYCERARQKRNNIHVYILEQNLKSGYIRIQFMLLAIVISRV